MIKARGAKEFLSYSYGKKISLKQSVLAKCFECCGNYMDGKEDCLIEECPLYPFMPYGAVWMGREKKIMSPEHTKRLLAGLKRGRNRAITTPMEG